MKRLVILAVTAGLCLWALATASAFAAAPEVSETTVSSVTTESARLEAEIDPQEKLTRYQFEYVDQAGFEASGYASAKKAPIPEGKVPASGPEPVSVALTGLPPETTYHFRLSAHNGDGDVQSADQTFATFAPSPAFAPCPGNEAFREGHPSALLPDCRAYEQASPPEKNGLDISGLIFHIAAASGGDRATFYTSSGIPGAQGGSDFPDYMSSRGPDGWQTQGLLPPPSFGEKAEMLGYSSDLALSFSEATFAGSTAHSLLLRQSSDSLIEQIVPPTTNVYYAIVGTAADDTQVFFEARGAALTADAAPEEDNLYRFERSSGALTLLGVLPDSSCATPPCTPPGGSFAGPYDWWAGTNALTLARGGAAGKPGEAGAFGYFLEHERAVAEDGAQAYFTAGATGQIYLRRDLGGPNPETLPVSESQKTNGTAGGRDAAGTQPAQFMAASADGSSAFFTSTEKLTDDATTGPEPPPPAIARANLGGTGVDQSFLPAHASAVAVDGAHIYWANPERNSIGRAELDGANPEEEFIAGADNPRGVAVDSEHIYWTNAGDEQEGEGSIGRARLGTLAAAEIEQEFIPEEAEVGGVMTQVVSDPQGIDVGNSHIYWVNAGVERLPPSTTGRVARASLNGDEIKPELVSCCATGDVAVNATNLYYSRSTASSGNGFIRRAQLDGTQEGADVVVSGAETPPALALDGAHLYWTNETTGLIGRSDLSGSEASREAEFIKAAGHPQGLAVDSSNIYWSANQSVVPNPGRDLYRFDATTGHLTDLTVDSDPGDPNGAEVQGVLGASRDGSYVYFVANGDLDGTGPATHGTCERKGSGQFDYSGACNLYLSHEGDTSFIARLDPGPGGSPDVSDAADWQPDPAGGAGGEEHEATARVSEDGRVLLFRSRRQLLTTYDNRGVPELYRYDAASGRLDCVSCAPSGEPPLGPPTLRSIGPASSHTNATGRPVLTRNLSADGSRVFFETPDKLVAADTDADQGCPLFIGPSGGANAVPRCQDVYEWEADGSGSCHGTTQNGGCLYLLSAGTGLDPAFLADASSSGEDVFILTREPLVPQDSDTIRDLYDVRVGGGLASQNAPPAPICEGEEACRGPLGTTPASPQPATPSFQGPGNAKPKRHLCPKRGKTFRKAKGRKGRTRCVKHRARHPRRHRHHHHRRANHQHGRARR